MAMDLTVSATVSAYTAQQAYSQVGGGVVRAGNTAGPAPGSSGNSQQSGAATTQTAANTDKQLQEVRKKNPAAEVSTHPGYAFEVDQQNHKIMKVSDNKGVLIYQVPSKGELALIESQDAAAKRLQLTA